MECLGHRLLGCEVGGGYLLLYEGVKIFVGKILVLSSFRRFPAASSLCM